MLVDEVWLSEDLKNIASNSDDFWTTKQQFDDIMDLEDGWLISVTYDDAHGFMLIEFERKDDCKDNQVIE